jgi:methionine-S-sulfoxide reductase
MTKSKIEKAVLAGGCFWGVEELFRQLPGVLETRVGYTGGHAPFPTYEQVCTGKTGHAEGIEIIFDASLINYADLLRFFFKMHDPTTLNRQGNDTGTQYRSAIFPTNDSQKNIARQVIEETDKSGRWSRPIVTQIEEFKDFYPAEEYHQKYLVKNPGGYNCHYVRE